MFMPPHFFSSIWVICKKDLLVWLRQPLSILGTLLVPISYFLVVYLGAQAVGRNPVAVVNLDQGRVGTQIVQAIIDADVFRVNVVTQQQARELYDNLQVASIITIPPDFSQLVQEHASAPVQVLINNYNLDLTNDIRRAVPDAITVYYRGLGSASPIGVTIAEHSQRAHNVELFQYSILPIIILIVTVNGVITSGLAATNEWEKKTIKELLLAPCGHLAIIVGKVLSGFITTFLLTTGMLAFGAALGLTRPDGPYWLSALIVIALGSFTSSGLGIAVGAFFQRKQPVTYTATIISVWLFAIAGGVGVIFFEPEWLQQIAAFDPITYAIHSLQMAVFYSSFDQFLRDVAVLTGTSVVAIALGSLAMRREIIVQ
jgi:ABC-type multidrug transport system permease subunit